MNKLRANFAASAVVCLLALVASRPASADSISLAWNPNVLPVAGYAVYVTPPSGTTTRVDVGSATLYAYSSAIAGQRYCFAVSAYLLPLLEGPKSGQVCGYSNEPPTLTNPGNQTSTVGQPDTLQLQGSDPAGQPLTYTANALPPGLAVMVSTGFISGTPTTAGTYSVTARASDGTLTTSQSFTWTVSASSGGDTTAPTVAIAGPTSATTYTTALATMTVSGASADSVGVTQVSWVNDRGGSGNATGTTSWSVASVPLQTGTNRITMTARDAAGNTGTDVLTVTRSTTSGVLTINAITPNKPAPQPAGTTIIFTATATGGTAPYQYKWTLYNGTTWNMVQNWTTSPSYTWTPTTANSTYRIAVWMRSAGNTVNAPEAQTNIGFAIGAASTGDTTKPTARITGPTSSTTYSTTSGTTGLNGTASDNVGVTRVTWANSRGGSGTASLSASGTWTVGSVGLVSGSNVITVTARDAAGNQGTDALTITYNSVVLGAKTSKTSTKKTVSLTWTSSSWSTVYVYRNGTFITTTANDGAYAHVFSSSSYGYYTYRICSSAAMTTCSNTVSVSF
ncbi:MAG TPA: putative Ig domain-containing protein [Vicinamibacterales bacterium]|nr:putative Ig domain-containing protein [Vicinamibacterales bacterium]